MRRELPSEQQMKLLEQYKTVVWDVEARLNDGKPVDIPPDHGIVIRRHGPERRIRLGFECEGEYYKWPDLPWQDRLRYGPYFLN